MASPHVERSFVSFFEGWLLRQQEFFDQLLLESSVSSADTDEQKRCLIKRVLSHYQEYYHEKARLAREDIFLLFSPTWLTSFEHTFLWITGFRPSLAFRWVMVDLTAEQAQRMGVAKAETATEERELEQALATVQERLGAPSTLELMMQAERLLDREVSSLDSTVGALTTSMQMVVERADSLRRRTVRMVLEVLSPNQSVRFLAAAAQFQLRIRNRGLQRESERGITS